MHIRHEPPSDQLQECIISKFYIPLDPYCDEQSLGHFGKDRSELSGLTDSIALQRVSHSGVNSVVQKQDDLIKESKASLQLMLEPSLCSLTQHAIALNSIDVQQKVHDIQHAVQGDHSIVASVDTHLQVDAPDILPCVFCCEFVCICSSNSDPPVTASHIQPSCACGNEHHISQNGHSSIETNSTSTLVISTQQRARIDSSRNKALAIKKSKRMAAHAAWPLTHLPASPSQDEQVASCPPTFLVGTNSQLRKRFRFGATFNSQELTRHKSLVSTNSACTSTG